MRLPGAFGASVQMCVWVGGVGSSLLLGCRVSLLHFPSLCSVGCRKKPGGDNVDVEGGTHAPI